MTKYQKAAARHIASELEGRKEPIPLFNASCIMDEGARAAGKKQELFNSLYAYADLLPPGWSTAWLSTSLNPGGDSMLYATPPGWKPGESRSQDLLMGGGQLVYSTSHGL